jgi:hypothetical protein
MFAWLALAAPSWALTVNVGGPGGYPSLEAAVDDANALGITEIDLAAMSWGLAHGVLEIEGLNQPLRIDGFGLFVPLPPIAVDGSDVTVANCYLAQGAGTGIASDNADLTLEAVTAQGDLRGVSATGGTLTISGGLYTANTGHAVLADGVDVSIDGGALFLANTSLDGGAALFQSGGGTLTVGAASFRQNRSGALGSGGAVHVEDAVAVALGPAVEFVENVAPNGGAVDIADVAAQVAVVTIDGATFTDNQSDPVLGAGGALRVVGVASLQLDFSTFSASNLTLSNARTAAWGGGAYLQSIPAVTATGDTFQDLDVLQGGGGLEVSLCPSVLLTDAIATGTSAGDFGKGGFLYNQGSDVTLEGGLFTGTSASSGAVVGADKYSQIGAKTTIASATADAPVSSHGGLVWAGSGSTVDVSFTTVTDAVADGGAALWVDGATSVSIADDSFVGSTTSGDGGAVTVTGSSGVFIERNTLCGNVDTNGGASALTASGGAISNNRIFGNLGTAAALRDGSGKAAFAHNTLVDNGAVALEIASGTAAAVDWNLFAPGLLSSAIQADSPISQALGDHNFVEDGALPGDAPLGFTGGVPIFQSQRPFGCDDLAWVSWADPVLVDFGPGAPDAQDIDGSALDLGAWGGPESYPPSAVFDTDGDGVRDDVDCAIADPAMFPGGPANTDCACDTDGDGWSQAGCVDAGASFDCADDDASIHPGVTDDPTDGVDSDCDGAPEDGTPTGTTGATTGGGTDTGPGGEEPPCDGVECDGTSFFGGGGSCSTTPGPSAATLLIGLAAVQRRKRKRP